MLLKLISCGSLALVSVLVVALLQGLRQHNQRIHALQERIDQLEERTPNRAHSEMLSLQMGVMQERMDAFSAMRTSAASSLHRCLLYTSPSPRDATLSRMPSSA